MSDDLSDRIAALERENAELRAKVTALEAASARSARPRDTADAATDDADSVADAATDAADSVADAATDAVADDAATKARRSRPQLELITADEARRSRLAKLMLAGGALAILGGIFASSWFAVICGLGWLFGGAAVASTVPQSGGDS